VPKGILGSGGWERDRRKYLRDLKKREAAGRKAITRSLKAERKRFNPARKSVKLTRFTGTVRVLGDGSVRVSGRESK